MNNKLLLVTCISLLFRESQIKGPHENSATLVRELVNTIRLPELSLGLDQEKEVLEGLKNTAFVMCDSPVDFEFQADELLQRLKVICLTEERLYQSLVDGIQAELDQDVLARRCLNLKKTLKDYLKENTVVQIMHEAATKLKFRRGEITNMREFINEVSHKLEPFQIDVTSKDPAVISDVDLSDDNAVTAVFGEIKSQVTGTRLYRTGYQGINRMLDGGFRPGEQWVIGALQHKYKTGFTLSLFKQLALYNKPVPYNPKKKPMLLRISFEDTAALNFQFLYTNLKENETGVKPDIKGTSSEEMKAYVKEQLTINGWTVRVLHVNPSLWTYRDICNKIIELEADGFEIHVCMLDYLLKVPTTGCDQGPAGIDIRNMYERIGNFLSARKIVGITPHQLSTEAKQLIRDGQLDFVKRINGLGYYAGCKQIDQVVDGELYIHIEEVNGVAYLTVQRGKHRKDQVNKTKSEHLYYAFPFTKEGGILDDINKADSARKRVGGGPVGSSSEIPLWDDDPVAA